MVRRWGDGLAVVTKSLDARNCERICYDEKKHSGPTLVVNSIIGLIDEDEHEVQIIHAIFYILLQETATLSWVPNKRSIILINTFLAFH